MEEHVSVLLNESIDALAIKPNGIYVDGTLGRGGHSEAILERLSAGRLFAFDKDESAIAASEMRLKAFREHCTLLSADFRDVKEKLAEYGVTAIDGMLLDLGVSSPQFDNPERGFSYRYDTFLDMRMDQRQKLSAYDIVNGYDEEALVRILYDYGEESFAKPIVRAMLKARMKAPIETTGQLVEVIKSALPAKVLHKPKHPAKQTFQALRIEVNDELGALRAVLKDAVQLLNHDGRLAVITFHSLEDRCVKQFYQQLVKPDQLDRKVPVLPTDIPTTEYELVNKKPIEASSEEQNRNNRAHSAKLRVLKHK